MFANVLLPCQDPPVGAEYRGLQAMPVANPDARLFASRGGYVRPHIRTLADLFCAWYVIQQVVSAEQRHPLLSADPASNADNELADLNTLIQQVPWPWLGAMAQALNHNRVPDAAWKTSVLPIAPVTPPPIEQIVEEMLVSRLGWVERSSGKSIFVKGLTVKQATSLQLGPLRAARRDKHATFVRKACGGPLHLDVEPGLKKLGTAFRKCWKLRWDNVFKEVYWRLSLDGLPTATRMHMQSCTCLCGELCPDHVHHFWNCPMAQAVVGAIEAELQPQWCTRIPGSPLVQQQHVWLMHPPLGIKRLHHDVWRIVCLAALNAMHVGLKAANTYHYQQSMLQQSQAPHPAPALPAGQRRITDMFAPAALTQAQQQHQQAVQQRRQQQQQLVEQQRQQEVQRLLHETKQLAVARFWELVTDWVVLNASPPRWCAQVAADHPFLCRDSEHNLIVLAPRTGEA